MMSVKAQAAIFVIIAIVLIVIAIAVIAINKMGVSVNNENPYFLTPEIRPQVDSINDFIFDCVDIVTQDAIIVTGMQGGFYDKPANSVDLGWIYLPYYYKTGTYLMPKKETIEREIAKYVEDNLKYCIDEFESDSFKLDYTDTKAIATIEMDKVVFDIDMPLVLSKEGNKMKIETDSHSKRSKYYDALEIAQYITDSHKDDSEMICISCVADLAKEKGMYVEMNDFGEDESTTLIVISEQNPIEPDDPFIFEFLNKYEL